MIDFKELFRTKIFRTLLFTTIFIALAFLYNYHQIIFLKAQSVHLWRQADCISFTMNYYHGGMKFFEPEIHNLISDNHTTGKTAAEFPIIYYIVAALWQIFGQHEFIFRGILVLTTFFGLLSLFRILTDLFKDLFWATIVTFLVFTSPMYVYYSISFLPNLPALNMILIGWYFFHKWYQSDKIKHLYWSSFFFALGFLLKVTAGITFVALSAIFVIELFGIFKFRKGEKIFDKPSKQFIPLLLVYVFVFAWYIYAYIFNEIHGGSVSPLRLRPFWGYSHEIIQQVWHMIGTKWIYDYADLSVLILSALLIIFLWIRAKKLNPFLLTLMTLTFIGSTIFCMFWFKSLRDHDYYVLNLLILPFIVFITTLVFLKKHRNKLFNSKLLKTFFLIVFLYNIHYCDDNMRIRYDHRNRHIHQKFMAFAEISTYNKSIGINPEDKVIAFSDQSFNIILHFMNQKGWNLFEKTASEKKINKMISYGAKYLFVNRPELLKLDFIQPYIKKKIGQFRYVSIYDLQYLQPKNKLSDTSENIKLQSAYSNFFDNRLETSSSTLYLKANELNTYISTTIPFGAKIIEHDFFVYDSECKQWFGKPANNISEYLNVSFGNQYVDEIVTGNELTSDSIRLVSFPVSNLSLDNPLLIKLDVSYEKQSDFDYKLDIQDVIVDVKNFDKSKGEDIVRGISVSGNNAFIYNSEREFGPIIKKTFKEFDFGTPSKIKASVQIYPKQVLSNNSVNLIFSVRHNEESLFYKMIPINIKSDEIKRWHEISYEFEVTGIKSLDDHVGIYVMNNGKKNFIIDDLKLSCSY